MRVGILGGTFDPIHNGHLEAARAGLECGELDEVLLVPAGRPPHKQDIIATAADRLEMCRLAASDLDRVGVWDWEVRRQATSFTVETLLAFRSWRPADEPLLVLGWDAAREIRTWHQPEAVLQLAGLVIVGRPGLPAPTPVTLLQAGLDPGRVRLCPISTPNVAATRIRRLAAGGASLAGLVPASVAAYVRERGLYRSPGQPA
ncbi:MAG: nicotinate-nucleotide adenylyltransferase [Candidatus Dormibacteraceae bacterium]